LSGDALQQIAALRDYLVRQTRGREKEIRDVTVKEIQGELQLKGSGLRKAVESISNMDKKTAATLRTLIIKTADTVEHNMDEIRTVLREYYAASSDFGSYYEAIENNIVQTAQGTVESYQYQEQINAANAGLGELQTAMTELNGQIRRGLITDPETGETALGIAISQELQFTGQTRTEDGLTYYELSGGQTLGIYTSTGWQFWINGSKRGWFDSTDGMLHVSQILVEDRLQHGSDWLVTTTSGYGIRFIGSTQ
jgi:hypothetical protein